MSRNRSCGKRKFACGVLFGGLIGGITALLYAPKRGEKLRKEISKKYCNASNKACNVIDEVCEQTCDLIERAKNIACTAKEAASRIYRGD